MILLQRALLIFITLFFSRKRIFYQMQGAMRRLCHAILVRAFLIVKAVLGKQMKCTLSFTYDLSFYAFIPDSHTRQHFAKMPRILSSPSYWCFLYIWETWIFECRPLPSTFGRWRIAMMNYRRADGYTYFLFRYWWWMGHFTVKVYFEIFRLI